MGRAVTVFLLLVCGVSALVTIGVAWLSDTWEREPLHLVENVLLLGVTVQLIIVIAGVSLFGFEDWSRAGTLSVVLPACALLPLATASLKELDEPFDGIVYAVAFACGG
jgi:RsiW-degrading membrane proteinase PrsW (M82 family)